MFLSKLKLGSTIVLSSILALSPFSTALSATPATFNTFLDWCSAKKTLAPATLNTINQILNNLGTQDCQQASGKLPLTFALNLSNQNITDLAPLATLPNLTQLNLYNNQIQDLTPLSSLQNLDHLILGNNKISDLKPLSNLQKLSRLSRSVKLIT